MVVSAGPKTHNASTTINESTWEIQNILKETLNSHISFSSTGKIFHIPVMEKLPCFCGSQSLQLFALHTSRFLPSQQMGLSEVLLKEETKQKV